MIFTATNAATFNYTTRMQQKIKFHASNTAPFFETGQVVATFQERVYVRSDLGQLHNVHRSAIMPDDEETSHVRHVVHAVVTKQHLFALAESIGEQVAQFSWDLYPHLFIYVGNTAIAFITHDELTHEERAAVAALDTI